MELLCDIKKQWMVSQQLFADDTVLLVVNNAKYCGDLGL